jgi:hypothetical protein
MAWVKQWVETGFHSSMLLTAPKPRRTAEEVAADKAKAIKYHDLSGVATTMATEYSPDPTFEPMIYPRDMATWKTSLNAYMDAFIRTDASYSKKDIPPQISKPYANAHSN